MEKKLIQEAEEQLKRALLMMKYDSSKTLTENKETNHLLKEQGTAAAVGTGVGAGLGTGAGLTALSSAGLGLTSAISVGGSTGLIPLATTIGGSLPGVAAGTGLALTTGMAVLGGAVGLAVVPLVYWFVRKDTGDAKSVKELFQMCSTNPNIKKLERKIPDNEIRNISDKINDAVNYQTLGFMAGTDEESLYEAFNSISQGTASDICALVDKYNSRYGDLYEDLDSDIDSPDEWKKIYRPIRNCVEDSLLTIKEENKCDDPKLPYLNPKTGKCEKLPDDGKVLPPAGPSYRPCKGTSDDPFEKECIERDPNGPIHKVQSCLGGLVSDGKFWVKTEAALFNKTKKKKFTKDEVSTICSQSPQPTPEEPTAEGPKPEQNQDDWVN